MSEWMAELRGLKASMTWGVQLCPFLWLCLRICLLFAENPEILKLF